MARPRIRIGNQTSRHVSPRLPYEFALQHGFDAFEWFSEKERQGWCEDDVELTDRVRLRHAAAERDLRHSVHAPLKADPTTEDGAAAILKSIQFAGAVTAGVVNIHLFPERAPTAFAAALLPLLREAARVNVKLSLENTPSVAPEHVNAVFQALADHAEAAGRVGMCLDSGHANLFTGTRNDYLAYVARLGEHVPIIHWHAHENWGDRDSHLPLFTGPSARDDTGVRALVVCLLRRGFAGSVVLEQWPTPPEQLITTRDRLRRVFEEEAKRLNDAF